jgi:hypothetical protein
MGTTVFRIRIELIFRRCWNLITPSRSCRGRRELRSAPLTCDRAIGDQDHSDRRPQPGINWPVNLSLTMPMQAWRRSRWHRKSSRQSQEEADGVTPAGFFFRSGPTAAQKPVLSHGPGGRHCPFLINMTNPERVGPFNNHVARKWKLGPVHTGYGPRGGAGRILLHKARLLCAKNQVCKKIKNKKSQTMFLNSSCSAT